jgi:transposase-like protein
VTDNRITDPMAFPSDGTKDMLTPVLHEGARRMLALAIETEVAEWIERRSSLVDDKGRRLVVRNGHQPTRRIQTGLGDIEVARPRVHDRRAAPERETFRSRVLPPYLRRTKAIEQMLPWLYLKGISTGGFAEALQSLLGPDAAGLSASTITRLMEAWQKEHDEWSKRSLVGCEYVYVWADGIYFNVRLGDESTGKTQCILVLVGATRDGRKELIAVVEGYRESEQSWTELINDVKRRGLAIDPKLAVADGALGFWAAVGKAWPTTRAQRCWVHKTANVLNKLPKGMQPKAKDRLHEIWMAATRKEAVAALEAFVQDFGARYESAVACLEKDRDELLAFYDFPAEHWRHLRTTNPIESTFSTVRLRHRRTKGNGSREACLAMVFKLAQSAERHWRRLNGHELLQHVIRGVRFIDGIIEKVAA